MEILSYYASRANEYEKVYAKAERRADLDELHQVVPALLAHRRVLDVACGTGYWTRRIAACAATVVGCDLVSEVLAVARRQQPATAPADFVVGDAFALEHVPGVFDASFVGFLWSHILLADLPRFLRGLHQRLPPESRVLILDNRYVEGSSSPISRTDEAGNTYQRRCLENGTEYEVLKNFPAPDELRDAIASAGGAAIEIQELQYFWYATYAVASTA